MKRNFKVRLVAVVLVMGMILSQTSVLNRSVMAEETAGVTDLNLLAALLDIEADTDGDGDISQVEMGALSGALDLRSRGISNITGLEYLSNVNWLNLEENPISNYSPLLSLNCIEYLWLNDINTSALSDFSQMSNLKELKFERNGVVDITPIQNLTSLEHLRINDNNISNIAPLQNMTNLQVLDISGNPVSNFSAISNLTNLRELRLANLGISSLESLSLSTSLTILSFDFNELSNIDALSNLVNLEYLALTGNNLDSNAISVLSNFPNATRFDLNDNIITDASVVTNCPELYRLELDGNELTDITMLTSLQNLGELTLYNNYIDFGVVEQQNALNELLSRGVFVDFEPQSTFFDPSLTSETVEMEDNLRNALIDNRVDYNSDGDLTINELGYVDWEIDISWRDISSLSGIEYMVNMTRLYANGNNITDLTPLTGLIRLERIDMDSCNISSLSPLQNLTNLGCLCLGNNNISDVSHLAGLVNLGTLHLHNNQIEYIDSITNLNLNDFRIENNMIDISEGSTAKNFIDRLMSVEYWWISYEPQKIIPQPGTDPAYIPDLNLLQALFDNGADYDEDETIRIDELNFMTGRLDLWDRGISNLTGLENLININELELGNNQLEINDINVVSQLQYLESMNIGWMSLSSLSGIQLPDSLQRIGVSGNELTSITPLFQYGNLNHIWADQNSIDDNGIANINYLSNLGHISLNNNKVTSLVPFTDMDSIWTLEIPYNEITDLSPLLTMDNLEHNVIIQGNYINLADQTQMNIINSVQSRCWNVEYEPQRFIPDPSSAPIVFNDDNLRLALIERGADYYPDEKITEDELRTMTGYLDLWGCGLTDLFGLRYAENIWGLNIGLNPVVDYSDIFHLTQLESICVNELGQDNPRIENLDGFGSLVNLRTLEASFNRINDVSDILSLSNLEELYLTGNNLGDIGIKDLNLLPNMRRISVADNGVTDISFLSTMTGIEGLEIQDNMVTDISVLTGLVNLTDVSMHNNLLSLEPGEDWEIISSLMDRGVYVEYEPQQAPPPDPDSESAGIVNENLRVALIEAGLDYYPDGELTQAELEYYNEWLWVNNRGITDISGLQYLTNAQGLGLNDNPIADISVLSGLTNLTQLALNNTDIDDYDLVNLSSLININNLNISDNGITNITPLSSLVNMEWLYIYNNSITDLTPVSHMTNVQYVFAYSNKIYSVKPIIELQNLNEVRLNNNRMNSLEDFTVLPSLTKLEIAGNYIDLTSPYQSAYLDTLVDNGCEVVYDPQNDSYPDPMSPVVTIPDDNFKQALIELNLDYNDDGDLTESELSKYQGSLEFVSSGIEDIEGIQYLTGVEYISLNYNEILDFTPVLDMPKLYRLFIRGNAINDLSQVATSNTIMELGIFDCGIKDVAALGSMLQLEKLWLTGNPIEEVDGLAPLVNLTYLSLWGTKVATLDPLVNLDNITNIGATGGLWDISALKDMDSLTYVYIRDNFLALNDDSDDMEVINILENRGVTVRYDNQTSIEDFIPDPESSPAGIEDDNLNQMLINIGLDYYPDGIITKDELRAWKRTLWLNQLPMTDLTGLEFLINATAINIKNSPQLKNFSPILGLNNLRGLYVTSCELANTDLNQFTVMDNLEYIFFDDNNLTNIDILATMNSLKYVSFVNNKVIDISALATMENLTGISGDNNLITSMSAFRNNDKINDIRMRNNRLTTAADLATMPSLGNVCIEGNFINLSDSYEINYINTIAAYIENFEYPYFAYEPQALVPDPGSPIVNFQDDNFKQALLKYNRDFNEDGNLTQDELATYCGDVSLTDANVDNLYGAQYLINAFGFYAQNNNISDISYLAGLTQLKGLSLHGNSISDFGIVSNMLGMKWLTISNTGLTVLPNLSALSELESLYFNDNNISDLEPLRNLEANVRIGMSNNKIKDISVLLTINGLTFVDVRNNFLDLTEGSPAMNTINTLIANGVTVIYEPQKPFVQPVDPEEPDEVEVVEEVVETTTEGDSTAATIDDNVITNIVEETINYQQESGETDVAIVMPVIETDETVTDASLTLDAQAMQAASENDIGLVVGTTETTVELSPSALDSSTVTADDGTIIEADTLTVEINKVDDQIITEPVFQLNEGGTLLGDAVEINIIVTEADGVTTGEITEFTEPVIVTIQLTEEDLLNISNPENLTMYWYDPVNNVTEVMPTTYDASLKTLSFTTYHFSIFIMVERDVEAPDITIGCPLNYEVLAFGTVISINVTDNMSSTEDILMNVTLDNGSFTEAISNGYTPGPGVYTLTVEAVDKVGNATVESVQFVIYDPEGGFVTGGGWINSQAGAYTANPSLSGKATFGFVSKYKKGANVPTGQTQFQFHVAGMSFTSDTYDWLVVAGTKAQFKGVGMINGQGEYGFLLTAVDGDSKYKPDRFRIKIWNKLTNEIIYDNQLGTDDSEDLTSSSTILQGGSIIVHK